MQLRLFDFEIQPEPKPVRNLSGPRLVWRLKKLQLCLFEDAPRVRKPTLRDTIKGRIIVALNQNRRVIGESHPSARLTDHEIDLIRELYEVHGIRMAELAEKFEVSKTAIMKIVTYKIRADVPVAYRTVHK